MRKVLILCTGNSCRSQMADGLLSFFSTKTKVYSAGTKPEKVNPYAIKAMAEIGIDISQNSSNHVDDYTDIDDIIRMCRRRIRVPDQWYGDYLAAIGAARIGERSLKKFVEKYGKDTVRAFVKEWLDYSERRCIDAIKKLPKGKLEANQSHDPIEPWVPEGIPVNVKIDIDPDDFLGERKFQH